MAARRLGTPIGALVGTVAAVAAGVAVVTLSGGVDEAVAAVAPLRWPLAGLRTALAVLAWWRWTDLVAWCARRGWVGAPEFLMRRRHAYLAAYLVLEFGVVQGLALRPLGLDV